jgi:hypothetical protein
MFHELQYSGGAARTGKCTYSNHGLINYIDNAKCRQLKILTCKGTLRQVYIRVIDWNTISHVCIFDSAPLSLSLVQLSPLPLPCVNKYTVYMYTVCMGGMGFWTSDR